MPTFLDEPAHHHGNLSLGSIDSSDLSSTASSYRPRDEETLRSENSATGTELYLAQPPPAPAGVAAAAATPVPVEQRSMPVVDLGIADDDTYQKSSGSSGSTFGRFRNRRCFWILVLSTLGLIVVIGAMLGALVATGGGGSSSSSTAGTGSTNNKSPTDSGSPASPTPVTPSTPQEPAPTPAPTLPPSPPPVGTPAPTSELASFLRPKLPDGGLSLDHADSYQSVALDWVQSNHVGGEHNAQRILQRFALACIYYATYSIATPYTNQEVGDGIIFGWLSSTRWMADPDECTWKGIVCNGEGVVTEIDLSENFLTGMFPPEVALLKDSLVRLDLFLNFFYNVGEKGNSFLGELHMLQDLNIAQTGFDYDGIPTYLGQLSNLVDLDVSYTLYFGELKPEIFANLPKLEYLYIGGNSYESGIPASFANLNKLQYFYADYTDLQGDLSFLTTPNAHPDLYEMWVDLNPKLTSEIPQELGSYSKLASLSLTNLDLFGNIPTTLGNLATMQQMWLHGNRLSGNIPSELASLSKLKKLQLEHNSLTGPMPWQICQTKFSTAIMTVLGSDCDGADPKVDCPSGPGQCCTCCGTDCSDNKQLQDGGEQVTGVKRDEPGTRHLESRRNDARHQRHLARREKLLRRLEDPEQQKAAAENKKKRLAFVKSQRALHQN
eukprot:CAMPEP_0172446544 /NCGR_PEP_ID=MMETSP1065-20121228/6119_1 /TAXON_ID=265537 /ORGANISM="Amphiprora paludosa, Strain CCMP125" /LENGTH=664 /DNA_ID=CAMNT_0013197689 /DNA_START=176 /DNA_END=2170 /DNA_ORIENTATION=-